MAMYSAYLPASGNREEVRFISDGPSILALIVPALFLIWHRLWQALMVYVLVASALALMASTASNPMLALLPALPGFFLMLQGRDLVRAKLEQTGWEEAAAIAADNEADAQLRFFSMDLPQKPAVIAEVRAQTVPFKPKTPVASGIFPE